MKPRFLNQKLGRRTTRRSELHKTKNQAKRSGIPTTSNEIAAIG
jgi:hypothetical protein